MKLVTFDCAGTLVNVKRSLAEVVFHSASSLGLQVGSEEMGLFQALYQARLPEFHRANLTRDRLVVQNFWIELAATWLQRVGSSLPAEQLQAAVDEACFGPTSEMFEVFEDVLPALHALRSSGLRLAVISNWDVSLHRVLDMFELTSNFEVVLASLEEGWEKPDPRLFELALNRCGVNADEAVHVGDDPIDDVQGPAAAGMRSVLLDRSGSTGDAIRSMSQLPALLGAA